MSYEDKVVVSRSPSPKTPTQESTSVRRSIATNVNTESPQTPLQQTGTSEGPVAILWDMENCPVPNDVRPEDVSGNIRMALRFHPIINGAVTMFSAYGDFNAFPRRLREGCQRTGVKLVDVPNGRKDAADKAILVDMFLFALDNRPPSSIMLISGDVDYSPALHVLGQRGYTIILVIPSGVGVSSALINAGRFVWDWSSVVRGEGFVPARTYVPRGLDFASCGEDEAIVYRGVTQDTQMYCYNSSRTQSVPSSLTQAPSCDLDEQKYGRNQPGNIQGLKCQMVKLLNSFGGSLPLVRVPTEYLKSFGRPLYMSEYGVFKLVNLIQKMDDTLVVTGSGTRKQICIRSDKKAINSPKRNTSCSSEEFADEDNERLDGLKREVQELLVCYSCPVPLAKFESLYERRYKKALELRSYGVDVLEELMEKVSDVVALHEDQGTKTKYLVSSRVG